MRNVCPHAGCDKRYPNEEPVRNHVIRIHTSDDKRIKEQESKNTPITSTPEVNKVRCNWPGCDYAATLDHLWQHQFIHKFKSQLERIVCNYANCGKTFSTKQHLMEHMNDVHNKNKELPVNSPSLPSSLVFHTALENVTNSICRRSQRNNSSMLSTIILRHMCVQNQDVSTEPRTKTNWCCTRELIIMNLKQS